MLLKPNDRLYLVIFDKRCMAGRIYGTTSCGPHDFREDVLANDSMASIDTRSMGGRVYVGNHKTYIYKLWVSPFQFFLVFPIISLCQPKNHMQPFSVHT